MLPCPLSTHSRRGVYSNAYFWDVDVSNSADILTNRSICLTHRVANASSVNRLAEDRALRRMARVSRDDMESARVNRAANSEASLA